LFGIDPDGHLPGHRKETVLIVFHATPDRLLAINSTRFFKTARKVFSAAGQPSII
jgi:hypothetical protein